MKPILVVDDNEQILEILTKYISTEGWPYLTARSGEEALELYEAANPTVILLDIMLPGEDGLTILRRLRERSDTCRVPVILVTAKDAEMDKVRGFELGADDYIAKPFSVLEMLARIKALLRRSGAENGETFLACGGVRLDLQRRLATVSGTAVELTFKEFELLHLLMKNCGSVVSRDVIMERVWGSNFMGESRTIDVHVKTLRQKLGECGSMIRTVRNVGYIAEPGR